MSDTLKHRTRWRNRISAAAMLFAAARELRVGRSSDDCRHDRNAERRTRSAEKHAGGRYRDGADKASNRAWSGQPSHNRSRRTGSRRRFWWNGPLDGAIRSLGRTIGYRVAISAPSNAQPLAIRIYSGPHRITTFSSRSAKTPGASDGQVDRSIKR
ncbi:DotD/TraH family lipoprotein [Methylocella tundrae]|uniref:DotD/TraH family lipoprotein n=1 Tax=Methylocella tundrae TaxID=227605 RepID=UPI00106B3489